MVLATWCLVKWVGSVTIQDESLAIDDWSEEGKNSEFQGQEKLVKYQIKFVRSMAWLVHLKDKRGGPGSQLDIAKSGLSHVNRRWEGTSKVGGKAVTKKGLVNREVALDPWRGRVMAVNTWKVQVSSFNLPLHVEATTWPIVLNHCRAEQHSLYLGKSPQMYVICIPKFSRLTKVYLNIQDAFVGLQWGG